MIGDNGTKQFPCGTIGSLDGQLACADDIGCCSKEKYPHRHDDAPIAPSIGLEADA